MRGPIFTRGVLRPTHAPSGKNFISEQCMCENFNFLALVVSEIIMRGPKFTLGGGKMFIL